MRRFMATVGLATLLALLVLATVHLIRPELFNSTAKAIWDNVQFIYCVLLILVTLRGARQADPWRSLWRFRGGRMMLIGGAIALGAVFCLPVTLMLTDQQFGPIQVALLAIASGGFVVCCIVGPLFMLFELGDIELRRYRERRGT